MLDIYLNNSMLLSCHVQHGYFTAMKYICEIRGCLFLCPPCRLVVIFRSNIVNYLTLNYEESMGIRFFDCKGVKLYDFVQLDK